jgi:hypothetical protein
VDASEKRLDSKEINGIKPRRTVAAFQLTYFLSFTIAIKWGIIDNKGTTDVWYLQRISSAGSESDLQHLAALASADLLLEENLNEYSLPFSGDKLVGQSDCLRG